MRVPRRALALTMALVVAQIVVPGDAARATPAAAAEFVFTTSGPTFDYTSEQTTTKSGYLHGNMFYGTFAVGGAEGAGFCNFVMTNPGWIPIEETGSYSMAAGSVGSTGDAGTTCVNGADVRLEFTGGTYQRMAESWLFEIDATLTVNGLSGGVALHCVAPAMSPAICTSGS